MAQTVDEIAELLNDMRIENERSNDNFERVLTGINAKLELMSEDNKDDLIRVYISELKKALEDRHSSALIKFDEIQKSFNIIQKRQDDYAKSDELKELARALTANFNTFFAETANRKEILDKIEEKVSDIDSTALDKKEILSMLENISSDLLSINANIEKTFLETSEVVKNIDLSDDFSNISKQISNVSDSLSTKINSIPSEISFTQLEKKIDDFRPIIESVKDVVEEASKQGNSEIISRFENIEKDFENIVTDSDFKGFRTDLAEFVQKIIDNTSVLNSELSYSTERIENILTTVRTLDFRDDFENITSRIIEIKDAFEEGARINYGNLSSEIADLSRRFNESFTNLDSQRQTVYSDLKSELSNILANLQTMSEISYQKSFDELSGITSQIAENVTNLRGVVVSEIKDDYSEIKSNLNSLISNLQIVKDDIVLNNNTGFEQISGLGAKVESQTNELEKIKTLIESSNTIEPAMLLNSLRSTSDEISAMISSINENADSNYEAVKNYIEEVSANINNLQVEYKEITSNSKENFESLKSLLENLTSRLTEDFEAQKSLFANMSNNNEQLEGLQRISDDIKAIENAIQSNREEYNSSIKSNLSDIKGYIDEMTTSINTTKVESDEKLYSKLANLDVLSSSFESAITSLNNGVKNVLDNILSISNSSNEVRAKADGIVGSLGLLLSSLEETSQKNSEMSFIISAISESVAKKEAVENIDRKIEEYSKNIEELKEIVQSIPNPESYKEDFSKLEETLSSALTKDDMDVFKAEYAKINQKIMDNADYVSMNFSVNKDKLVEISERLSNIESVDYSYDLQNISSKIDDLSLLFENSSSKNFEELSGLLASLKTLNESMNETNKEIFDKQFVKIEESMAKIMTAEDFVSFKSELVDLVQKLFDSLNLSQMSSDSIKEKSELILEKINLLDYRTDFENIANSINDTRLSFENNSKMNYENILNEINNLKTEINANIDSKDNNYEKINSSIADVLTNIQFLNDASSQRHAEILDNISSELHNAISSVSSDLAVSSDLNFGELRNSIENLQNLISDIKLDISADNEAKNSSLSSDFDSIKASIGNLLTMVSASNDSSENQSAENTSNILSAIKELSLRVDELKADNGELYTAQFKNISQDVNSLKLQVEETVYSLKNYMQELQTASKEADVNFDEKISNKLMDLEASLQQSTSDYDQKAEVLQARLAEFIQIIEGSNSDTEGKISSSLDELFAIKGELNSISDSLQSLKISNDDKLNETVSLLDASVENILFNINSISDNISSGFDGIVKESISSIEDKFAEVSEIISKLKEEYSSVSLFSEIDEKTASISGDIKLLSYDITEAIQNKSEEIVKALEPLKNGIDEFVGFDFEKIVESLKSQIELSFMNFNMDMNSEILSNSEALSRLEESYKETYNKISLIENCVAEKIQNNIELVNTTLESSIRDTKQKLGAQFDENIEDLKSHIDVAFNDTKIQNSINELKEELLEKFELVSSAQNHLSVKEDEVVAGISSITDNIKAFIAAVCQKVVDKYNPEQTRNLIQTLREENTGLRDKIDEINSKLDVFVTDSSNEEIQVRFDDLADSGKTLSDMVELLNAKVDAIASDSTSENIVDEIDEIKNIIFEQRKFFELASDEKSAAIDKYLRDVLVKLDNVDIEKNAEDIKESIMNALVSLIDQVSFVEEAEDIKDFVEEKTDEINKNIQEVQSQLKQLATADDDSFDYKYTLQDVESDIARLRLAMNNMQNIDFSDITNEIQKITKTVETLQSSLTQDQLEELKTNFEKISEDIVSISSRTNKLLLNSDESYKALNDGLNNFSELINKLEDRINYLDNTEITERIEKKIDKIQNLSTESVNANKVSHQVMMYLGEWVDSTTERLSSISDKTVLIPEIQNDIEEIKTTIPDKNEIVNEIKEYIPSKYEIADEIKDFIPNKNELVDEIKGKIPDKEEILDEIRQMMPNNSSVIDKLEVIFARQEERIDVLENKIEKILSTLEQKDDMVLNRKVDKIERLISGLGANIEKLTSYVDEE